MKQITEKHATVLICCSGGVDSTALIHYYFQKKFTEIYGIHFDYGQPSYDAEKKAIFYISDYYGISVEFSELRPLLIFKSSGEFLGRNALFILSALNRFKWNKGGIISLGIHANTPYYDCTLNFCRHIQLILDGYCNGTVKLDTPFLNFTKKDIFLYCYENQIPIELTYSCENSSICPCGSCASCIERKLYDSSYSIV